MGLPAHVRARPVSGQPEPRPHPSTPPPVAPGRIPFGAPASDTRAAGCPRYRPAPAEQDVPARKERQERSGCRPVMGRAREALGPRRPLPQSPHPRRRSPPPRKASDAAGGSRPRGEDASAPEKRWPSPERWLRWMPWRRAVQLGGQGGQAPSGGGHRPGHAPPRSGMGARPTGLRLGASPGRCPAPTAPGLQPARHAAPGPAAATPGSRRRRGGRSPQARCGGSRPARHRCRPRRDARGQA